VRNALKFGPFLLSFPLHQFVRSSRATFVEVSSALLLSELLQLPIQPNASSNSPHIARIFITRIPSQEHYGEPNNDNDARRSYQQD
jgi:hypothetical protein